VSGALVATASACKEPAPKTVSASDLSPSEYSAGYRIAAARCERQSACSGSTSSKSCVGKNIVPSAAEAQLEQCVDPIDKAKLDACIGAIRNHPCTTDINISELKPCQMRVLCPAKVHEGTP